MENGNHFVEERRDGKQDGLQEAHSQMKESDPDEPDASLTESRRQSDLKSLPCFTRENPKFLDETKDPIQDPGNNMISEETRHLNGLNGGTNAENGYEHASERTTKRRRSRLGTSCRLLLLDIPLAFLFCLLMISHVFLHIHNNYFVPFFSAAEVSDERLEKEHTYYDRMCSMADLSTDDLSDIVMTSRDTSDDAVDTMLTHGGVVIPKILKPDTIKELRNFVVKRNAEIWDRGEAYPVSQGENGSRASFGIDAAEHPIVAVALREVATHHLVKGAIPKLVGNDPAIAEITAITAYQGCDEQAWHSDVKIEGNAVKFARTFTHSYSLFVPLQDTTSKMGATEFCPGTHFCANEDLIDLCDQHGMQVSEASSDKVWHAGDGALLSQQAWHRGQSHTDFDAPERIVFIVTFISRPQLGKDHRQLSRGTYFHLKWNMWGHTFQDLLDADVSMEKPYSVLRCLRLWKPSGRNWGYDLLTSSVMRISNSENGLEPGDLPNFIENVIGMIHLPEFLQGPVLEEDGAWQIYLQTTLDNCFDFFFSVNAAVLVVYGLFIVGWQLGGVGDKWFAIRSFGRLMLSHGTILLVCYAVMRHVVKTNWGQSMIQGQTLRSPFPVYLPDPERNTTLPDRPDVLVGSRFDSKYIGAFNRYLDYHPGNKAFRQQVASAASTFATYRDIPLVANKVVDNLVFLRGRRFLQQVPESGDWVVMNNQQSRQFTNRALLKEIYPVLGAVDSSLAFLIADQRFGRYHATGLSKASESYLCHLRDKLFTAKEKDSICRDPQVSSRKNVLKSALRLLPRTLQSFQSTPHVRELHQRRTLFEGEDDLNFQEGDAIIGNWNGEGEWFEGIIMEAYDDGTYYIAYEDGSDEESVPSDHLVKRLPLQTGDRVSVNYRDEGDWFLGTVLRVAPSASIDVRYDDGDVSFGVPAYLYRSGVHVFMEDF